MTLQLNLHTTALLFVLFSMFTRRCIAVRPKSLSVDGWYPATPGRSRSRRNFTDSSSDSDSRKNGRLRSTPTPASTPTPQPCPYVMLKGHITLSGNKGFSQKSQPNVMTMGLLRFFASTCNLLGTSTYRLADGSTLKA